MREGNGEDLIERVCQPMEGDKSGVGTNPSFVKVKEVDEKNSLPGNRTDGRKMILYRDHIEGIAGEGPFTTKEWLQVEFGRKHGTTDWEPRRILGRTKDPKKKDEWVKRTVKPEAPKPSEESD